MSNPDDARTTLKHAFQLIKAGEKQQARKIIGEFLKTYPRSADGWYLAALVTDEPDKKLKIVERVLSINPQHSEGKKLLDELTTTDELLNELLDNKPVDKPATPKSITLPKGTAEFIKGRGFWFAVGALIVLILVGSIFVVGQSRGELLGIVFRASITPIPTNTRLPTFTRTPTYTPSPSSTPTFTPSPSLDFTETAAAESRTIGTAVAMTLAANGNTSQVIQPTQPIILHLDPVTMSSATPENRMVKDIVPIDYVVRDAVYDAALQKIIMISDSTRLHIYDPETHNDQTFNLARETLSLSISPDGMFAAVGHDALVSYVDLKNGQLVRTFDVPTRVDYLVLAGNGWVYVEFNSDFESVVGIQITTGRQLQGSALISESVLRLNPNGKSLYGAEYNISPEDILRVDIGPEGFPDEKRGYSTNSPYHGDYEICGNLWLSQDGQRIFTACGAIFRASDDPKQDMTYNGSVTHDLSKMSYMFHSQAAGIVVGLSAVDGRENLMGVWNYENLTLLKMLALPDYHDQLSKGHFVFINSTNTRYYVILSTYTRPSSPRSYGMLTGDLAELNGGAPISSGPIIPTPQPQLFSANINPLNFNILDAEYSTAIDRLIAISNNPDQVHIYDPQKKLETVVDLPAAPINLSVSPDGFTAAVALSTNSISIIDLKLARLTKTLNFSNPIDDILLAGNGWVYLSTETSLFAVNISTNEEVTGPAPFGGNARLRLHPDSQKIYGVDTGANPSDLIRANINLDGFTTPIPYPIINSTYHGDYELCENLWVLQDGQRILTGCGDVFLSSDDHKQDMTHIGTMGGTQYGNGQKPEVRKIEQLTQAGKLLLGIPYLDRYPMPSDSLPDNRIFAWNAGDLTFRKSVTLEDWSAKGLSVGRFVFVNAAGTQYYVIAQAGGDPGRVHDFAIITGNISDL